MIVMKTSIQPLYLTIIIFFLHFVNLSAQLEEIGLRNNPLLVKHNSHQRSEHGTLMKIYLPVGGSAVFCPKEEMLMNAAEIRYRICSVESQGSFDLGDTCVSYQHHGTRSTDVVCLEICDSNGLCENYEIAFISGPVLALPFVDDFSADGPYPDTARWLDRDVFVNTTLAERPLTVGVATFDGLDAHGSPYGEGAGFSDNLTSAFMDLSEETEVYFSFFAQPKGVGIKPRDPDSLVVDFRNKEGQWVRVWQMQGLPNDFSINDPAPDFAFNRWIIPDSFLHSSFQFRFRNKSKNEGLQELWHVDYIRVGEDDLTREQFRDIAFRYLPTSVLSPYSGMPAHQFAIGEVRRNIISRLNNLDQVDLTMNDPTITISLEGQTLLRRTFIEPVQAWLLSPGSTSFDFDMNDQGSTNYESLQNALLNALQPGQNYQVRSTLNFTRFDEILGATSNNEVTTTTHFANYYAYDDGTAESAIIDRGSPGVRQTLLAMEFHNNTEDQLQGVQIHIPHIEGNSSTQTFNLYVWIDSLDDDPEFFQPGVKVYYADTYYDTLQGFTTYDLRDSADQKIILPLPAGRFYIGWEQVDISGVKIPIGYDINSPEGINFLYYNVGQGWLSAVSSGLRHGSLMLRPVLGTEEIIPTGTATYNQWDQLLVFPNPSSGRLYLSGDFDPKQGSIELFDLLGRSVLRTSLQHTLDVNALKPGSYLLRAINRRDRLAASHIIQIIK
jgi:hypothetical protein